MKNKAEKDKTNIFNETLNDNGIKTTVKKPSLLITSEEQFREFWLDPDRWSKYGSLRFTSIELSSECEELYCDMKDEGLI